MDYCYRSYQRLVELNLFDTETDNAHVKRNEVLSTRLYIIILIVILSLFAVYTLLLSQTSVVTIAIPTQKQYEERAITFSNSLQCPCKHISIPYEQFITIVPRYHEICSSDFVSQKWIEYLFYENTSYYFQLDFRQSASAKFQLLRTLCQQAQNIIDDSLEQFYSTQFITKQLISKILFDAQANAFIDSFKRTTPSSFQNTLTLLRQTIAVNAMLSAVDRHYTIQFWGDNSDNVFVNNIYYYETISNGKFFYCDCDAETMCQLPEGIYANIDRYDFPGSDWGDNLEVNASTTVINATFLIPGMIASCRPDESLMRSTLECLYERICLNQIASYVNYTSIRIDSFSVLNRSQLTRQISIRTLANNLFLEEWIIDKSYEKYFNSCQPLVCQYKDEQNQSFIQVIAGSISLYGGLRIVLTLCVPIVVTFIRKKKHQQTTVNINLPYSK